MDLRLPMDFLAFELPLVSFVDIRNRQTRASSGFIRKEGGEGSQKNCL
jgi:hypothetical protein